MKYYLATQRIEVLIHATTWIKFENILFSGRSQSQKPICCIIHLYEMSRIGKCIETENGLLVAYSWVCGCTGDGRKGTRDFSLR
jgi:hypothetical protein